ncbi:hypothetical protein [Burkholderia sp. L27(2015)]|jgi:hypothetical protein|uniref:hypothetical protein n=1 Tax=Burkholderia sp. L27(2015) TaxID=1641858 RepID=UPI00131CC14B|nr:hypothetical protein [Burkholderia sp. L27(2015)]
MSREDAYTDDARIADTRADDVQDLNLKVRIFKGVSSFFILDTSDASRTSNRVFYPDERVGVSPVATQRATLESME